MAPTASGAGVPPDSIAREGRRVSSEATVLYYHDSGEPTQWMGPAGSLKSKRISACTPCGPTDGDLQAFSRHFFPRSGANRPHAATRVALIGVGGDADLRIFAFPKQYGGK